VILSSSYDGDSPANPIAEGFHTFIVSKDRKPLTVSGAMKVIPDYSFRDAPQPNVILVGAQPDSPELLAWLKSAAPKCDIVASVCVGAYFPARAGMLDGRKATTHHDFYDVLAKQFPKVQWLRGPRWVEEDRGRIITAGGEASGMDLALRIVDRYYGDSESQRVKFYTELSTDTPRPA
jgi:transcriptional regulator GlxA family with amidase domain